MSAPAPARAVDLAMRPAARGDAAAISAIYNEGIADRIATFETELRREDDILAWFDAGLPVVVAERGGTVLGYAVAFPYSPRPCYSGVGEFSVYVSRSARGEGIGRMVLAALMTETERRGYWKLVSRVFPENRASLALCRALGFREVGLHRKHAKLDGVWRDVVVVERLLGEAADARDVGTDQS